MDLAPIILFVYNRPWHTEQVLENLMKNDLADESILFIYSDGPKLNVTEEQKEQIEKVRKVIKKKQWCKEVYLVESPINKGLGPSVKQGVSEIIEKYEKAIVLEDDLIISVGFLKFMNESLELYKNDDAIMQITGTNYSSPLQTQLPDTFFAKYIETCGWATWKRAWKCYNSDTENLYAQLEERDCFFDFDVDGVSDFKKQLELNIKGVINTWGVRWLASVYLNKGLVLYPRKTLVYNIGFDGSGDNCGDLKGVDKSYWKEIADYVYLEKIPVEESQIGREHLKEMLKIYCNR